MHTGQMVSNCKNACILARQHSIRCQEQRSAAMSGAVCAMIGKVLTYKPLEGDESVQALLAVITTCEQAQHDAHHWSCRDQGWPLGPSRDPTLHNLSISHMCLETKQQHHQLVVRILLRTQQHVAKGFYGGYDHVMGRCQIPVCEACSHITAEAACLSCA